MSISAAAELLSRASGFLPSLYPPPKDRPPGWEYPLFGFDHPGRMDKRQAHVEMLLHDPAALLNRQHHGHGHRQGQDHHHHYGGFDAPPLPHGPRSAVAQVGL